ncbi:hypothetical protein ABZ260_20515 [Streptosporangium sp. NPDC006013]|uniref:hypothetical protein n=1 Tax=Streptosporangium sp. NPDC006013 TaxID=3155596 RepID=UPI0033A8D18E
MLGVDAGTATGPVPTPSVGVGRQQQVLATPLLLFSITVVVALAHLGGAVLRRLGRPRVIVVLVSTAATAPLLELPDRQDARRGREVRGTAEARVRRSA